ncbi:hypothetical protein H6P81_010346 [Aristolochia fimbriata]|uniref:Tetratricopeptide repeat protein 38 n=1 Tax=Aristolochia fimbriata TaxID=158543 RepID=A0AAV7EPM9_ARIFI|nr:hypothetical protein H6P81_010346 [Aristolochia fimbriata]
MDSHETRLDQWGYSVRTSSDGCISAINSFYDQVLNYGRQRSVILQAPLLDAKCVLANTLAAHFLSVSDRSLASTHLSAAQSRLEYASEYESAVFVAIWSLIKEDRDDEVALDMHLKLLKEFPRDLVSLKRAQVLCFYTGRPEVSLRLVEQVLPQNKEESYVYGMLSFPLLELGRMEEAEKAAKRGLEINKKDVWSQHNLCHVFQNDCHFKEAVEFMEGCSWSWSCCSSFMYTHNWWHVAVCYLEGHSPFESVLKIYDHHILEELQRTDAEPGEVYLNALGLLLRAYLRGKMTHIEDRLRTLANRLTDKSVWHSEWLLDVLALWALAISGEVNKAEELLKSIKSRFYDMSSEKQQKLQRALSLAEAMYEYGNGNFSNVYELLGPNFEANNCKVIGASDEQLEVFDEVWLCVLLGTGHASKAIEEIKKKIKKRERVPFLWRLLEKGFSMTGKGDSSSAAKENAIALEAACF